jgi:hypothetical protein
MRPWRVLQSTSPVIFTGEEAEVTERDEAGEGDEKAASTPAFSWKEEEKAPGFHIFHTAVVFYAPIPSPTG